MLMINCWNKIKEECKTDTIAVIGNAPSALYYRIGTLIDNYSCVLRMNNFQIKKEYTSFIGTKTDVFVTNFHKKDLMKTPEYLINNGIKIIWSSIPNINYGSNWRQDIFDGSKYFHSYKIFIPNSYYFFNVTSANEILSFIKFFTYTIVGSRIFKILGYKWPVASTGLMSIMLALDLQPKKIIITGFDFFTSDKSHYFDKSKKTPTKTHHLFSQEPYIIRKLILKHPNVEFHLAIDPNIKGVNDLHNFSNVIFYEPYKNY
ncbi:MAG: glycosyltransferase family 29 protein [Candidatus Omnitrophica bacterium]|nr:glycosyltransferase family 29 protein [Candidatus Omnitrophota bacterium]